MKNTLLECLPMITVLASVCISTCASALPKPTLRGPDAALLDDVIEFRCESTETQEAVTYVLLRDNEKLSPVATQASLRNQTALFNYVVKNDSDGYYICKTFVENSTISPQFSNKIQLRVIIPVSRASVVSDPGPDWAELFEGDTLTLRCEVLKGNHLSYEWYFNTSKVSSSAAHRLVNNMMVIDRVSVQQAGIYSCIAKNQVSNSSQFTSASTNLKVIVKVLVSKPEISYAIIKEDSTYWANIMCKSIRGTPPVTFTLCSDANSSFPNVTTDTLNATFSVPVALNQHVGDFFCGATNGAKPVLVPVGGQVSLQVTQLLDENFSVVGVQLLCSVERGSFPRFSWFFNGSQVPEKGDFHAVMEQGRSLILFPLVSTDNNSYQCAASDSFDDTQQIRSVPRSIELRDVYPFSMETIAIVFSIFLFLMVLVAACCVVRLRSRPEHARRPRSYSLGLTAFPTSKETSQTDYVRE
ncbi:Fc receptor-like protein 5 isoform X2 [Lepisosteus oculatus]|uniref:Fc receptor-like protein 5 isoform X2 n=1 Tax=Lepisosteus oculatus TaxID=7918 RepID=UPI0037115B9A